MLDKQSLKYMEMVVLCSPDGHMKEDIEQNECDYISGVVSILLHRQMYET